MASMSPRITRSMTSASRKVPRDTSEDVVCLATTAAHNSTRLLAYWNIGLVLATAMLLSFVMVRFTMSRQLQQLDSAIKDMDQVYFQNLSQHLSSMYFQMRHSFNPQSRAVGRVSHRGPRVDHAQSAQGAKVVRFSGEELPNAKTLGDKMRLTLGFTAPKAACNVLGRRVNRNKFLTFKGDRAKLLIQLNSPIFLDTFRVEHFLANPNATRDADDADDVTGQMPRQVAVAGVRKMGNTEVPLGRLDVTLNGNVNIQTGILEIDEPRESFELFQVEVLNNYGSKEATRVYKIRMYGMVDETK